MLGPLLFLPYVNDIPASVSCKIKLFADDTKMWKTIKTQSDSQSLQSDLDLLSKWSDEWLLRFNTDKCHIMHTDRKSKSKYYLEKDNKCWKVTESEVERDLRIWVFNIPNWETQCKNATAQAISVLGMIKITFPFVDVDGFKLLYNVYSWSHLEFCVQSCSPYLKKDIDCMEKIQRRTTRMVMVSET